MGEIGPKLETWVGGASHAPIGHGVPAIVPETAPHDPQAGPDKGSSREWGFTLVLLLFLLAKEEPGAFEPCGFVCLFK